MHATSGYVRLAGESLQFPLHHNVTVNRVRVFLDSKAPGGEETAWRQTRLYQRVFFFLGSLWGLAFGFYERHVRYGIQTIEIFFGIDRQSLKAGRTHGLAANDQGGPDLDSRALKMRSTEFASRG